MSASASSTTDRDTKQQLKTFDSEDARQDARQKALDEASSVLEAAEFSHRNHLEDFNLLGVVTSPRMLDMTRHQRDGTMNSIQSTPIGNSGNETSDPPAKQSLTQQSTITNGNSNSGGNLLSPDSNILTSMTESISKEIGALNTALYSYSQNYLGNYYLSENDTALDFETELGYDDLLPSYMEDLPDEIVNLDLSSVEGFFRKSGAHAVRFGIRSGENDMFLADDYDPTESTTTVSKTNDERSETTVAAKNEVESSASERYNSNSLASTSSVPDIFFSPYFDLTNPKIFESLLLRGEDDDTDDESQKSEMMITTPQTKNLRRKKDPNIRIQQPETFTQHLDTIELALLNQVRSKSESFFRETNRFTYLKSLVAESVREVESLRAELQTIRERSITEVELIPVMDKRRQDMKVLEKVLDEITHIVEVKSGVAGLIAAGDYLGAVEAINLARSLLNGDSSKHQEQHSPSRYMLGKLAALSKVNDQLAQYENLVVMDLSNELIEIFLTWGGSSFTLSSSTNTPKGKSMIPSERRLKVKHIIQSLKKCRKLTTMAVMYKEKLCDTIRVTIRTTISECAADATKSISLGDKEEKVSENGKSNAAQDEADSLDIFTTTTPKTSITDGVTSMSYEQCMDCLQMIFEQVLSSLQCASGVSKFCLEEGISLKDSEEPSEESLGTNTPNLTNQSSSISPSALSSASDLSLKSLSEILRLRKEAHSLISFDQMKRLWDASIAFTLQVEKFSGQKAYGLRSTLLSQAKAFVERKHEANMASLVAALDGERWTQCDISDDRQSSLTRLCSGRAVLSSSNDVSSSSETETKSNNPFAEVDGKQYRVVWSCLLLVEMIMNNVACAAHFQSLASNIVSKVSELLRLFNSRTSQLVLGAGAIQSAARLKSINAKHLALVTQCVGLVLTILPHVRAALMAQLPNKQHTLLVDLDKIKREYADHSEKVLSKFVSIIGGIVQHGVAPRLSQTDFDQRSKTLESTENDTSNKARVECCPFLTGVVTNTKKMHQVLVTLLPAEDLKDVFSRIFAHLDSKIPTIFMNADSDDSVTFSFPVSIDGKRRLVMEVEEMFETLNNFPGVRPWDFAAKRFLERRMDISDMTESPDEAMAQPDRPNLIDEETMEHDAKAANGHIDISPETDDNSSPGESKEESNDNATDEYIEKNESDSGDEDMKGKHQNERESPGESKEESNDNATDEYIEKNESDSGDEDMKGKHQSEREESNVDVSSPTTAANGASQHEKHENIHNEKTSSDKDEQKGDSIVNSEGDKTSDTCNE